MQNNCSARASRFFVHFIDVRCTTTTWSLPMRRFMENVDIWRQISFLYLNMDKVLNNSTPGKVAYICRIERFQIDALKIERTQTHFLVMFSLPSSSSSMLKVPICTMTSYYDQQNFSVCCFFVQSGAIFLNLSQGWKDLFTVLAPRTKTKTTGIELTHTCIIPPASALVFVVQEKCRSR